MAWVAWLGGRVQPKTIKAYLTHLRSLHVDTDLPFSAIEAPVVQRLIRGIKRYHGEAGRKPKQPITLPILRDILSHMPDSPQQLHLRAACCLAYSALLRCGEFTTREGTRRGFGTETGLTVGSIRLLPDATTPTHATIFLPGSKTDPFRKGTTITVAAAPPGSATCPVGALKALFEAEPRPETAALFEERPGMPLSRGFFLKMIRAALLHAGYNPSEFAGHSFRRGAASSAAVAGYSDYEIQLLGRWRSDAFKLYLEVDQARLLQLSRTLHLALPQPTAFEPPGLRGLPVMA